MVWSLWIIYILFAKNVKANINTNIFRFKTFNGFEKIVPTYNSLHKLLERAHALTSLLAHFA